MWIKEFKNMTDEEKLDLIDNLENRETIYLKTIRELRTEIKNFGILVQDEYERACNEFTDEYKYKDKEIQLIKEDNLFLNDEINILKNKVISLNNIINDKEDIIDIQTKALEKYAKLFGPISNYEDY